MVFEDSFGERSITTREILVNDLSVVQFDVRNIPYFCYKETPRN